MRALILSGGGARCAYHAGVLRGVARILRALYRPISCPFPIICGASGGAINAVFLATYPRHFGLVAKKLFSDWRALRGHDVYSHLLLRHYFSRNRRTDGVGMRYLLSNEPLMRLLETQVDFSRLHQMIAEAHLHALSISAFSYASHQQLTFVETAGEYMPWSYPHARSVSMPIDPRHVLASSAVPFVFSPQVMTLPDGTACALGDGSIRELSPCHAAIRLGARRLLVIGAEGGYTQAAASSLSWGQVARSFFSSTFLDALSADQARLSWSQDPVQILSILPSSDPLNFVGSLRKIPRSVRLLARLLSGQEDHFLLSHFLFEPDFLHALLRLGEYDALSQTEAIVDFFTG